MVEHDDDDGAAAIGREVELPVVEVQQRLLFVANKNGMPKAYPSLVAATAALLNVCARLSGCDPEAPRNKQAIHELVHGLEVRRL